MPTAVVLLSGGLDSATCLAIAKADCDAVYALSIDYGQRHRIELDCAAKVASSLGIKEHRTVSLDLRAIGGSALTSEIDVPKGRPIDDEIPVTYVPARNTVFLAIALGFAEVVGADRIYVGVNAVDYSGYPDCRPEFIKAFQGLANLATKAGVEGRGINILTPLIDLTKPEIIRMGLSLGVNYELTSSCYDPLPDGAACGQCDSCQIRQRAFREVASD